MAFLFELSKTTILNNLGHCNAKPNKNMNGIRINSMINDWIRIRISINSEFYCYRLKTCVTWRYLHNEIQSIFQKKKRLTENRSEIIQHEEGQGSRINRSERKRNLASVFFFLWQWRIENLLSEREEKMKKKNTQMKNKQTSTL